MKLASKKLFAAALMAAPALAMAHPGHGDTGGMMAGLLHPIGGLDHVLAMLAVGLWASSFHGKARWAIPAAFVGMMSLGFLIGANGGSIPLTEQGIAASVLIIGLAAAWVKHMPAATAAAVVGLFAMFHGAAHGAEMAGDADNFALGFIISTVLLHAAGFFTGAALQKNVWLNRAIGTAIGSVGLYLLFA